MATFGVNVAVLQDNQVLLIKRRDFPVWSLPGGAIDNGESVAQAAIRETREETGLEVVLDRLVGVYSRPNWRLGGDHNIVFTAKPIGGMLRTATSETVDTQYYNVTNIPADLLWYHHQRIVDALSGVLGAVWTQNAIWPLSNTHLPLDVHHRISQGDPAMIELQKQLYGRSRPEQEQRDV